MCGLGNEAHQKRLLSEPDQTLDKALVPAKSLENADVNVSNQPYSSCHRDRHTSTLHLPEGRLGHHLSSLAESVIVVAVGIT